MKSVNHNFGFFSVWIYVQKVQNIVLLFGGKILFVLITAHIVSKQMNSTSIILCVYSDLSISGQTNWFGLIFLQIWKATTAVCVQMSNANIDLFRWKRNSCDFLYIREYKGIIIIICRDVGTWKYWMGHNSP